MILRWISYSRPNGGIFLAAVNTLIAACIFSWLRLLNIMAINYSLVSGNLYQIFNSVS